jgi:hypothetical protein
MMNITRWKGAGCLAATALAILSLLLAPPPAGAELERVGPVSTAPTIGGYPAWYQDTTGIVLEFCDLQNAAELAGSWCLLAPGDATFPETFPTNFADEHFYYSVNAEFPASPLKKILWEAAVEAAFAVDVAEGGQMVFTRIRMRLEDVPVTGTYRFLHPYGEDELDGVANDRIFFTEDVGVNCAAGTFDCAMQGRFGPYLLPADANGNELPPVAGPVPGKLYLADPARIGPVTNGPVRNFVRIEGPQGSNLDGQGNDFIQTSNFSMIGRLRTAPLPSRVALERTSYTRPAGGTQRVDVYASGQPTVLPRLPGSARPSPAMPALSFFTSACGTNAAGEFIDPAGQTPIPMASAGTDYWGRTQPAVIPSMVCVKDSNSRDANGVVVPTYYESSVADEVFVTEAVYVPTAAGGGTLSVKAESSDQVEPRVLTLLHYGETLANGQKIIDPLVAPPNKVRVLSDKGGLGELQVLARETADVFVKAAMVSPAPNSTLPGATNTFTWNAGSGALEYWLEIGTTLGGANIFNAGMGSSLTTNVTGIPTNGQPVYARLSTRFPSGWQNTDYQYTAAQAPQEVQPTITSPAPGGTLAGTSQTFSWGGGAGALQYWLEVGTTPGGANLFNASTGTATSASVSSLPTGGVPIYVRLSTRFASGWQNTDYTFTSAP